MKSLIAFTLAAFCMAFRAAEKGGDTGDTSGGPGSTQPTPPPSDENLDSGAEKPSEAEADDTDYMEEAQKLGVDLPVFPNTPVGIAQGREELKRRVLAKRKENEGKGGDDDNKEDDNSDLDGMKKADLIALAEQEGVELEEGATKEQVVEAIKADRAAR